MILNCFYHFLSHVSFLDYQRLWCHSPRSDYARNRNDKNRRQLSLALRWRKNSICEIRSEIIEFSIIIHQNCKIFRFRYQSQRSRSPPSCPKFKCPRQVLTHLLPRVIEVSALIVLPLLPTPRRLRYITREPNQACIKCMRRLIIRHRLMVSRHALQPFTRWLIPVQAMRVTRL